ncbi:Integral membrane protein [Colletotrichum higginsianum IMI 349063]|uniref:Integral membrane protein n=1 Tax=Colletotrichum higginsianum (strain IMI 349063) TaxID=759273 RepID=A0A1B7YMQ5_COLHI|nr:Integral membrane protein [Colletotrichum higginsianum IMI 349063]OBR13188.1 Integral membrane protein [Colletotrichum higginsianum IMI 349063]
MDGVPWEDLPHDDYGPGLLATVWTLAAVAGAFIGLRVYCKFSRGRGLWLDDHVLFASWCAMLALCAFITVDVSYDFGKHNWDITPGNWSWLLLYANLAGSLSIIAAAWSKTSFALTLLRIAQESPERWMKRLVWFIIVSINVALGLSVLFTWIQCWPVEKTWRTASTPGTCWPKSVVMGYNVFTAAYSGAMDIVLAVLPWRIIWGLTMTKREKLGVLIAMSMGVFAGAVSFIKIRTIAAIGAFDIIDTVELVIWGAAESAVTIIAATIPILRALFRDNRPAPARFATDEESMIRRLGAVTVAAPVARGSRSDLELVEWKHTTPLEHKGERSLDSRYRIWRARGTVKKPRRMEPTTPPDVFKGRHGDPEYSGSMELSRRLR